MTDLSTRIVAAVVGWFPSPFRERFRAEMLSAFLDQRDAIVAGGTASSLTLWRHTLRTVVGLLRALAAVRFDQRRRLESIDPDHHHEQALMRHLASDARHAVRALRSNPAFTIVCITTLALGIGANTAVFNVLNRVILAPLPYDQPEQLVRLYTASRQAPAGRNVSRTMDLVEARDGLNAFSSVGFVNLYSETGVDLLGRDGAPHRVRVLPIGADYFRTLRATPLLGRTFTRDEERPDAHVVILSHQLWADFGGGDSSIVGRAVDMNGERYEVVGVMRPTFTDIVAGEVAAWTPQNLQPGGLNNQWNHFGSAIARLRPGVSIARAQAELTAMSARMHERYPDGPRNDEYLRAVSLHDDVVGEARSPVYVLMGAAGLVLLIASVNVANLFLARSVSQARDTIIRSALGARRSRLVGLRLTESLVVAAAGGMLGSVVAYGGVKILLALSPESLARAEEVQFDWRLLLFALLVTTVTGLVFGAAPAVRATQSNPSDVLREGSRGNTGGRGARHARRLLVASQVALAVVLLVGTGILIRSFVARQRVSLGFDPANVLTFEVHTPDARYGAPEARVRFHELYRQRLRSIPGVTRVGATSWLPTNGDYHEWGYEYVDDAGVSRSLSDQVRVIDGDYLEALGIPLIAGRRFGRSDRLETSGVALISRSMAKRAYGDRDPIGRRFETDGRNFEIVGVVGDVANGPTGAIAEMVYLSHAQFADERNWALTYVVKTTGAPNETVGVARRELAQVDPGLVVYHPRTMEAVLARHLARDRFTLVLMAVFAAIALSLAAVGVYGVLSYAVSQRTHEIGVRLALGALPGQVQRIVLREGVVIGAIGTATGVAGALALGRVLQALVFGTSTKDPLVFVAVTVVLGTVVLAASYLPARRATQADPLDALRNGNGG